MCSKLEHPRPRPRPLDPQQAAAEPVASLQDTDPQAGLDQKVCS